MLKIAVPTVNGLFSSHFGGAERFMLYDVDETACRILGCTERVPPPHEHGSYPAWLKQQGVNAILAGGMGPRAVAMLRDFGIQTVVGVQGETEPTALVQQFLEGRVEASGESCHDQGFHGCGDRRDDEQR
jgi:predicted Fe-Mo cluster-binding NifX family protein